MSRSTQRSLPDSPFYREALPVSSYCAAIIVLRGGGGRYGTRRRQRTVERQKLSIIDITYTLLFINAWMRRYVTANLLDLTSPRPLRHRR